MVKKLDENCKCLTIFVDLPKAFDTVSVPFLLTKLQELGIIGAPLALLSSYLTGRTQSVRIADNIRNELAVTYGVPQGSIMGPTLFFVLL